MTQDSIPDEPRTSYYDADRLLQAWIAKHMSESARAFAEPRLRRMGRDAAETIAPLAAIADRESPKLVDGNIEYHPSYREMERIAYGSQFIALKYDPAVVAEYPAQVQKIGFALGYLFGQAEAGLFCPACMTDGVARVLVASGDRELANTWVPRLCFTQATNRTTGAMFLTERQGGSDVGASVVRALRGAHGMWELSGEKFFCSNADAELALVLARPDGAPKGTRGLGLFLLPRDLDGKRQTGISIRKLKDKLGVRSMPTAEIELVGARAWQVGPIDHGFRQMVEMVNYSRLYNAVGAASAMARACYEAQAWASERQAFGRKISEHPLGKATLQALTAEHAGAFVLAFEAVAALDRADAGDAEARVLFRAITPLAKYHTAKAAVACCSEAMEVVGGNGYIEDRAMSRMLRDAQVLPIWEGTTNIQILDAIRGLRREGTAIALTARLTQALERIENAALCDRLAPRIAAAKKGLLDLAATQNEPDDTARPFFDSVARTLEVALLAELGEIDTAAQILAGKTIIR